MELLVQYTAFVAVSFSVAIVFFFFPHLLDSSYYWFLDFISSYVYKSMSECGVCAWLCCPLRSEERVGSPGADITGSMSCLAWVLGIDLRSPARTVFTPDCWAISLALLTILIFNSTLIGFESLFLCLYNISYVLCVYVSVCMYIPYTHACADTRVHIHIESKGQPWVSFLRHWDSCLRQSLIVLVLTT